MRGRESPPRATAHAEPASRRSTRRCRSARTPRADGRRAHERQRLQGVPRGDARGRWDDCVEIARDADPRRRPPARPLRRLRRPRRRHRHARGRRPRSPPRRTLPIMLDSTEPPVIEAGLEILGGRCVINSVNFEDGDGPESRCARVMPIITEHGAAVVALSIDEEGQARTAEQEGRRRRAAHRRPHRRMGDARERHPRRLPDVHPRHRPGGEPRATASRRSRRIRELKRRHPDVQTTLGLSNISFGLNPAARVGAQLASSCTSASQAGLDAAIVHASKILPMSRIPDEQREVALDLIYDRASRRIRPAAAASWSCSRASRHSRRRGVARGGACRAATRRAAAAPDHRRRAQRPGGRPRRGAGDPRRRSRSSTTRCWPG